LDGQINQAVRPYTGKGENRSCEVTEKSEEAEGRRVKGEEEKWRRGEGEKGRRGEGEKGKFNKK
jgi:hypothetical protein